MSFKATTAAQAAYTNAPKVALNIFTRNAAILAVKGDNAGLFALFCDMIAAGEKPSAVRTVGADVRSAVREELRERAGFTRVKLKGAKESGAPDYSTASVYANTAANYAEWLTRHGADMAQALEDCQPDGAPLTMHASGIPAAQSTAARVLRRAVENRAAQEAHEHAALRRAVSEVSPATDDIAVMATALHAAQAEAATARQELAQLQAEHDAMRAAQTATAE